MYKFNVIPNSGLSMLIVNY